MAKGAVARRAGFAVLTVLAYPAYSADWLARMMSFQGTVEHQIASAPRIWEKAIIDEAYGQGDRVRTGARSNATLQLRKEHFLKLDQNTVAAIGKPAADKPGWLNLLQGALRFRSRIPGTFGISTPFVNAMHRGTEFQVEVRDQETLITVFDGEVEASNPHGTLSIAKGQAAIARTGEAPRLYTVVKPEDAVQWSLYYPPVIDFSTSPPGESPVFPQALALYHRNDIPGALKALETVPPEARNNRFLNLRAGLLLTVGRLDEAGPDIAAALQRDPRDATALAQQAVIAVARNQKDEALRLARQAVDANGKSSSAKLALSYAQQAHFDLPEARESIRAALRDDPQNALVLTRLAELELSLGERDKGEEAATEALRINPRQGRARSLLGFAQLLETDTGAAIDTFKQAIADDPGDPLTRFGLGLAKIRKGKLEDGTTELETAADLSPDDPLIRSYLGKAYYEQKRSEPAATEYGIAKALDPKDPTPYYYEAIKKQTENRPVEALKAYQKAIELNGNRAVYRSTFGLDQDVAARTVRLSQTYRDLGYEQLALLQGWQVLSSDPTDFSAHRILSDSYTLLPLHEIARDSELLQSQLLQPFNLNPVQPRRASDRLLFLNDATGPANIGYNEYARLFASNGPRLHTDFSIGNNGTLADNAIVYGIQDKLAYSFGQFHSETNGFRANNDEEQNIYNGFVQAAPSENTTIIAEARSRQRDAGDRTTTFFDDANFNPTGREANTEWSARIGIRHTFAPSHTLLATYSRRFLESTFRFDGGSNRFVDNTNIFEARHIYRGDRFSFTEGIGYVDGMSDVFDSTADIHRDSNKLRHINGYGYGYFDFTDRLQMTLGLSVDSLEDVFGFGATNNRFQLNPKLGVLWRPTDRLMIRGAAFRSLKRPLVTSQTIEPTLVAGFNQFFDGFNGNDQRRYGIGLDYKFSPNVYSGAEASVRDDIVPVPQSDKPNGLRTARDITARTYLYWIIDDNWFASAQYQFTRTRGDRRILGFGESDSHSIPLNLRFAHPSGFFARLGVTYFDTQGVYSKVVGFDSILTPGADQAFIVDAALGYRLPKRLGIVSILGRNLFDSRIRYNDPDFTAGGGNDIVSRGRLIMARFTLDF